MYIYCGSPEKCIVQESCLMFGPVIFELRNLKVEASKRVSTKKKSSTFSCSQTKVFLEEICSHLSIAMRIWMTFFNRSLIGLQTLLWTTIWSPSVELERFWPFYFTVCILLSKMGTKFVILILNIIWFFILIDMILIINQFSNRFTITSPVVPDHAPLHSHSRSKGPQVSSTLTALSQRLIQSLGCIWKVFVGEDLLQYVCCDLKTRVVCLQSIW